VVQFRAATRFNPAQTPLIVLAEGCFGEHESKTGVGVIRYGEWPITAVIDSTRAGKTVQEIIGTSCTAPVVESLSMALALSPKPQALLIGTAPMGGGLPDHYRAIVKEAIHAGLHIISGLHIFLNDQPDLKALAAERGVVLWDVRAVTEENIVTRQLPRPESVKVITMVGSDCSVGKMSVALEIDRALRQQGESSAFVATGQTGIMITGSGVPLDRVIGDFMAGYLEVLIDETIRLDNPEWVIVEGQGSLLHPAYSGVTLSLLHGSAPDGMILCHNPKLKGINNFEHQLIPPLSELARIYEAAAAWIKPAKVHGIALNTSSFSEAEALGFIREYEAETGLPVTDTVRFGAEKLVEALKRAF
jgi:uncharacterized NAD-dependent epimerase/dehydratase family protein